MNPCYRIAYFLPALMMFLLPSGVFARDADVEALRKAFENSARAEGARLDDYNLIDQDGAGFKLSEYFKTGKPLVVSFIYTTCKDVCPTITAEFKKAVNEARQKFGDRFNVLSIAFDPARDKPEKLKEYGRRFTSDFRNFRFATSDEATMEKLTGQFGFFHVRNDTGGFDHIDMASVIRPDGVIYKQVYGVRTQSNSIGLRIEELLTGKAQTSRTTSLITRIAFFCTRYDPVTGRNVIDYPTLVGFFLEFLFIGAVFIAVWGRRMLNFSRRRFGRGP